MPNSEVLLWLCKVMADVRPLLEISKSCQKENGLVGARRKGIPVWHVRKLPVISGLTGVFAG